MTEPNALRLVRSGELLWTCYDCGNESVDGFKHIYHGRGEGDMECLKCGSFHTGREAVWVEPNPLRQLAEALGAMVDAAMFAEMFPRAMDYLYPSNSYLLGWEPRRERVQKGK